MRVFLCGFARAKRHEKLIVAVAVAVVCTGNHMISRAIWDK